MEMPQSSTSALGSSARMTHSLTINFQDRIRNRLPEQVEQQLNGRKAYNKFALASAFARLSACGKK